MIGEIVTTNQKITPTGWFTEITIDNKSIYCLLVFFLDHPV